MSPTENSDVGKIAIIEDDATCERLWKRLYPRDNIFDLWEIREIFARHFGRKNCFVVHYAGKKHSTCPGKNAEGIKTDDIDINDINGMLPPVMG